MNGDLMLGGDAGLQGQSMAPFLTKLFQIVSNLATDQAIIWTPKGDSFVITDPETFARDILPTYFKHNNIRSFIRQLNTYGFRKRTNISSSDDEQHPVVRLKCLPRQRPSPSRLRRRLLAQATNGCRAEQSPPRGADTRGSPRVRRMDSHLYGSGERLGRAEHT